MRTSTLEQQWGKAPQQKQAFIVAPNASFGDMMLDYLRDVAGIIAAEKRLEIGRISSDYGDAPGLQIEFAPDLVDYPGGYTLSFVFNFPERKLQVSGFEMDGGTREFNKAIPLTNLLKMSTQKLGRLVANQIRGKS